MAIHIKILTKKAKLRVRLFLLFTFFSFLTPPQSFSQSHEEVAFGYYLNLQFDSCLTHLPKLEDQEYAYYLKSLIQTSKIFLSDDVNLYKSKKGLEDQFLEDIESFNFSEKQTRFLQSEVKIQWAILKMKYGDEFSAFWNMKQAYNISSENIDNYPNFIPSYKSMGLLYVLFGIVPEKFNWVLSIFGIEGDVEHGLELLTKVPEAQTNYALESHITIALLNSYLLNNQEAGIKMISETQKQYRYLMIEYVHALIAIKNGKSEGAMEGLEQVEKSYNSPLALAQIYYLLGEIYLQKGDISLSITSYQKFIKNQKGLSLLKDAYFKIGICQLINGKESLAKQSFNQALSHGWTKNEADSYAQSQIESGQYADKNLYRLRFATDGGYFENAAKIQSEIDQKKLSEEGLCEYYYRTGRLMQKTNSLDSAILKYERTIEMQGENHWYFAPNAALQLGYIYLNRNNSNQAKEKFEKVFDYRNHPYEKSIRQKAKTALKTID